MKIQVACLDHTDTVVIDCREADDDDDDNDDDGGGGGGGGDGDDDDYDENDNSPSWSRQACNVRGTIQNFHLSQGLHHGTETRHGPISAPWSQHRHSRNLMMAKQRRQNGPETVVRFRFTNPCPKSDVSVCQYHVPTLG